MTFNQKPEFDSTFPHFYFDILKVNNLCVETVQLVYVEWTLATAESHNDKTILISKEEADKDRRYFTKYLY